MTTKQQTVTARQQIETLASEFVASMVSNFDKAVEDEIKTRLQAFAQGLGSKPLEPKNGETHVKRERLVCPVKGCTNLAAPRHGMVCKDHETLPKDEKALLRIHAREKGGVWHKEEKKTKAA